MFDMDVCVLCIAPLVQHMRAPASRVRSVLFSRVADNRETKMTLPCVS